MFPSLPLSLVGPVPGRSGPGTWPCNVPGRGPWATEERGKVGGAGVRGAGKSRGGYTESQTVGCGSTIAESADCIGQLLLSNISLNS